MYVRYPLSLRNVEDLLHERGIDICYETVRKWVGAGKLTPDRARTALSSPFGQAA
jgi:transposase-like protein